MTLSGNQAGIKRHCRIGQLRAKLKGSRWSGHSWQTIDFTNNVRWKSNSQSDNSLEDYSSPGYGRRVATDCTFWAFAGCTNLLRSNNLVNRTS